MQLSRLRDRAFPEIGCTLPSLAPLSSSRDFLCPAVPISCLICHLALRSPPTRLHLSCTTPDKHQPKPTDPLSILFYCLDHLRVNLRTDFTSSASLSHLVAHSIDKSVPASQHYSSTQYPQTQSNCQDEVLRRNRCPRWHRRRSVH